MRGRLSWGTLAAFVVALSPACGVVGAPASPEAAAPATTVEVTVRDDLRAVFAEAGVSGAFALLDVTAGRLTVVDRTRAETRAVPASTFKIAHSIIALETAAARDADEVIPYGGQPQPVPAWEQDMSIREVGPAVDRFWLDGPLAISPVEQVRFLERLARRTLPASRGVQDTVAEVLVVERNPQLTLHGKTGWRFESDPQLGWWVGWVERTDGRLHAFALNMDMAGEEDAAQRIPIGRELLRRLDIPLTG